MSQTSCYSRVLDATVGIADTNTKRFWSVDPQLQRRRASRVITHGLTLILVQWQMIRLAGESLQHSLSLYTIQLINAILQDKGKEREREEG